MILASPQILRTLQVCWNRVVFGPDSSKTIERLELELGTPWTHEDQTPCTLKPGNQTLNTLQHWNSSGRPRSLAPKGPADPGPGDLLSSLAFRISTHSDCHIATLDGKANGRFFRGVGVQGAENPCVKGRSWGGARVPPHDAEAEHPGLSCMCADNV